MRSKTFKTRPVRVLLVEDNPADVRLTREALQSTSRICEIAVAGDGEAAIAYLRKTGNYQTAPGVDLILLDLNLPKIDGRQVLEEIKKDPALARIPVIVLTTSTAQRDVSAAYDLHANSYVTKPRDLDDFLALAESIKSFWFSSATLPTLESSTS